MCPRTMTLDRGGHLVVIQRAVTFIDRDQWRINADRDACPFANAPDYFVVH